jgi:hypothetical protein
VCARALRDTLSYIAQPGASTRPAGDRRFAGGRLLSTDRFLAFSPHLPIAAGRVNFFPAAPIHEILLSAVSNQLENFAPGFQFVAENSRLIFFHAFAES